MIVMQLSDSARDEPTGDAARIASELGSRIGAYADIILHHGASDKIDLWILLADHLRSAGKREGERIVLSGPDVALTWQQAALLNLAFHELLDNAFRYGSLGADDGRVEIDWTIFEWDGRSWLGCTWSETSGRRPPAVPVREGFGFGLLRHSLPRLTQETTTLAFEEAGLRFQADMPLEHFNRQQGRAIPYPFSLR